MMARDGARLLMLGTPNGGSWAPMQVLSGDDTFGNALAAFGAPFRQRRRAQADGRHARLPPAAGRAARPGAAASTARETWQKLADDDLARVLEQQLLARRRACSATIYQWGVPPQDVLDQAVALRRRLDAQAASAAAGRRRQTAARRRPGAASRPTAIDVGDDGLVYLDAPGGGDGRVTLTSALLPGVRTWTARRRHTATCPTREGAFAAYLELLTRGETALLDAFDARRRRPRRGRRRRRAPADARRASRAAGRRAAASRRRRRRRRPTCSASSRPARRRRARRHGEPRAARHGAQRRPDVRAPAAGGRPLPLARADRHRSASSTGSSAAR